jgi:hypothetical protein
MKDDKAAASVRCETCHAGIGTVKKNSNKTLKFFVSKAVRIKGSSYRRISFLLVLTLKTFSKRSL